MIAPERSARSPDGKLLVPQNTYLREGLKSVSWMLTGNTTHTAKRETLTDVVSCATRNSSIRKWNCVMIK
jgi:hypothetical protein